MLVPKAHFRDTCIGTFLLGFRFPAKWPRRADFFGQPDFRSKRNGTRLENLSPRRVMRSFNQRKTCEKKQFFRRFCDDKPEKRQSTPGFTCNTHFCRVSAYRGP